MLLCIRITAYPLFLLSQLQNVLVIYFVFCSRVVAALQGNMIVSKGNGKFKEKKKGGGRKTLSFFRAKNSFFFFFLSGP